MEKRCGNEDEKPWRFVFDTPYANGKYTGDPLIQICSGSPDYHRFVMTFTPSGVPVAFDVSCVTAIPHLMEVKSERGDLTLAERKAQDEEYFIQRIAFLGAARLFIHKDNPSKDHVELVKFVEEQSQRFLDVFEHAHPNLAKNEPVNRFRFVNGGWAGKMEGSTGLPMISKLFGTVAEAEDKSAKRPVTVMPSGGAYDRVEGTKSFNYFEVPGSWGDDSKYLIGYSSAAVAFAPYGFWTEIELRNAIAQGKPTIVIADESKLDKLKLPADISKVSLQKLAKGEIKYLEVPVDLPEGKKGNYRIYTDGKWAAIRINRCWNVRVLEKFVENTPLEPNIKQQLTELKNAYLSDDKPISYQTLIFKAKKLIPQEHKESFNAAVLNQTIWSYRVELVN
jgi:hypothetical protein